MPLHFVLHRGEQFNGCHLFANPIIRPTFSLSRSLNNDPFVSATLSWPFAALCAVTFGCLLSEASRKRTHSVVSICPSHSSISTIDVELGACHTLIANVVSCFWQLCMHIRWCGCVAVSMIQWQVYSYHLILILSIMYLCCPSSCHTEPVCILPGHC